MDRRQERTQTPRACMAPVTSPTACQVKPVAGLRACGWVHSCIRGRRLPVPWHSGIRRSRPVLGSPRLPLRGQLRNCHGHRPDGGRTGFPFQPQAAPAVTSGGGDSSTPGSHRPMWRGNALMIEGHIRRRNAPSRPLSSRTPGGHSGTHPFGCGPCVGTAPRALSPCGTPRLRLLRPPARCRHS